MSAQFRIRRACRQDARVISGILHEAFQEFRPLYTEGGFSATVLPPSQVLERMGQGPAWLAETPALVIGTVAALQQENSIYVRGMAVLPVARGCGAGSALLRQAQDWALDQSGNRLYLSTTPFLHSAIRLYEKFGFSRIDEEPRDLFGTALFFMEKHLS